MKRLAAIVLMLMWLLPATVCAAGSVQVFVPVSQTFTKNPTTAIAGDTFTYALTRLNAMNPLPTGAVGNVYSFTVSGASASQGVGPITYTAAGIYEYELKTEASGAVAGYAYDAKAYTVTVYVRETGAGFDAKVIIKQKGATKKVETAAFAHSYTANKATNPSLMTDPPVEKLVSGDKPSSSSTFTFRLTARNASQPMPSGSANGVKTITITGSGKKDFGTWSYAAEGTYYYTVSEVNSGVPGYTYDTMVYTITDTVKAEKDQLVLTRVVTNNANKRVDTCLFVNKYTASNSGGGSAGGGTSGPKTGDDTNPALYRALICASGLVCALCALYLLLSRHRKQPARA